MTDLLQAIIGGLAIGGIYALAALSFSITFTTTRTLNFAQGDFTSVGALIGASIALLAMGRPFASGFGGEAMDALHSIVSIVVVVATCGLAGAILYLAAVKPFAGKPGLSWVMSTLGFGVVLQSVALGVWGPGSIMVPSPFGDELLRLAGAAVRPQELLVIAVSLGVALAFDWMLNYTIAGKTMRAVAHSPQLASLMGINVGVVMIAAFATSTALAGLSGVLIAPITSVSIYMGLAIALKGFCSAIVGGMTNPRGCVIGGFALGLLESTINLWQAQWREVVVFMLVILVLSVKPTGLFGKQMVEKV